MSEDVEASTDSQPDATSTMNEDAGPIAEDCSTRFQSDATPRGLPSSASSVDDKDEDVSSAGKGNGETSSIEKLSALDDTYSSVKEDSDDQDLKDVPKSSQEPEGPIGQEDVPPSPQNVKNFIEKPMDTKPNSPLKEKIDDGEAGEPEVLERVGLPFHHFRGDLFGIKKVGGDFTQALKRFVKLSKMKSRVFFITQKLIHGTATISKELLLA